MIYYFTKIKIYYILIVSNIGLAKQVEYLIKKHKVKSTYELISILEIIESDYVAYGKKLNQLMEHFLKCIQKDYIDYHTLDKINQEIDRLALIVNQDILTYQNNRIKN